MNNRLINFIANIAHLRDKESIDESTRLEEDLYFYGENAEYLLARYSYDFNVDISDFDFSVYFTQKVPHYGFYKRFSKRYRNKRTITIGDLARGIRMGRLDDEVIDMKE